MQTRMFYRTVSGANIAQERISLPTCTLVGVSLSLSIQAGATVAGYAVAKLTLEGGTLPTSASFLVDLEGVIAGVTAACDFGVLGNAGNANQVVYVPLPGGIRLENRPIYLVVMAAGVSSFTQAFAVMQYDTGK